MEYLISDLVNDIQVVLDRNQESGTLVSDDTDVLSQRELVEKVILEAARLVLSEAPTSKLDCEKYSPDLRWSEDNGVFVADFSLPDELMRLVSVKSGAWRRNATIISEDDDEYAWQCSKYGIRGNADRPIAVFMDANRSMQLYSFKSKNYSVVIYYVSAPVIEDSNIDIPQQLKDSIVYMAAHLVCVSIGDTDTAASMRDVSLRLAGIEAQKQT